jgi:acyl carrier protein
MTDHDLSESSLTAWLGTTVARLARIDPSLVGPTSAFDDLGLSSLAAVTLTAELSQAFGIEVDPTITWDYPTIGEVARALAARAGEAKTSE